MFLVESVDLMGRPIDPCDTLFLNLRQLEEVCHFALVHIWPFGQSITEGFLHRCCNAATVAEASRSSGVQFALLSLMTNSLDGAYGVQDF